MGILDNPRKKEESALVFDVGSASVGGALFYAQASGAPQIVYSIREPIVLEEKLEFEKFFSLTLKSLESVAESICSTGLAIPDKIFCVLSSPWYVSQIRNVAMKKNTPFTFTPKLANSLIQKEVSLFEEECRKKCLHSDGRVIPIELKNMRIKLNGYATPEPLNQKALSLEMALFVSICAERILEKIKEAINRHFFIKKIRFSSFTLASFAVARDVFIHQDNFLLIDIGGEVADISMIKKDVLCSSVSFPLGRNFLIRGLASILGCSLEEAKSYLSLYKDGHISDPALKKVEPVINKLKSQWLAKFQESLINLSNDISIPSTIFLTVDQALADFFIETIKSEQFNQYTLTESKFKVVFLGTQALHGIALFQENVIRDPFVIIESIYVNRFLHF